MYPITQTHRYVLGTVVPRLQVPLDSGGTHTELISVWFKHGLIATKKFAQKPV